MQIDISMHAVHAHEANTSVLALVRAQLFKLLIARARRTIVLRAHVHAVKAS